MAELCLHVRERVSQADQFSAIGQYCLAMLTGDGEEMETTKAQLSKTGCPDDVRALLRHRMVQIPLAARSLFDAICVEANTALEHTLPFELIESVARLCKGNEIATRELLAILNLHSRWSEHAMAASILYAVNSAWRPKKAQGRDMAT